MCCNFWEKCIKQSQNWSGVQYPLKQVQNLRIHVYIAIESGQFIKLVFVLFFYVTQFAEIIISSVHPPVFVFIDTFAAMGRKIVQMDSMKWNAMMQVKILIYWIELQLIK